MRVVSLVPSVTETLLAWRVPVAACTRFCEQPHLPHVGGTKDPDIAAIVALAPDLVVVDREENRREDAEALSAAGLRVHVTHVVDVDGVPPMLAELAAAAGVDPEVIGSGVIAPGGSEPTDVPAWATAVVLIWRRPWMCISGSTYGSSLLRRIGVVDVMADADTTYPEVTLDEIADRRPTFVVLPSEPYPFAERHVAEITDAIPDAIPVLLDGRDLFWWGTRTGDAIERLRAVLREASTPS